MNVWLRFRALVISLAAAFCPGLPAADPVQFVVAQYPAHPLSGLAAVYTLSSPERITEARKRVAVEGATNAGDLGLGQDASPFFRIAPGSDQINRDVHSPGEPFWNWHIEDLLDYSGSEADPPFPLPAEE